MTIFMITNKTDGKRYIGWTCSTARYGFNLLKLNAYKAKAHKDRHQLYENITKHGPYNFTLTTLNKEPLSTPQMIEKYNEYVRELNPELNDETNP